MASFGVSYLFHYYQSINPCSVRRAERDARNSTKCGLNIMKLQQRTTYMLNSKQSTEFLQIKTPEPGNPTIWRALSGPSRTCGEKNMDSYCSAIEGAKESHNQHIILMLYFQPHLAMNGVTSLMGREYLNNHLIAS